MPKLLFVTTIPSTLTAFLLPYSDYFRKKGWQVDALTGEGPIEELLCRFDKVWQVKWSRNPLSLGNMIGTPQRIYRIVQQEDYDIVHVHTPVASFVTRFALRNLRKNKKVKVVYTAHGFHFYKGNSFIKNTIFISLEKIASYWTDHLIVINEEDYEAALKYGLGLRENVTLHPGIGVDMATFSPEKVADEEVKSFRDSLGLKSEDLIFVMIAEFNPGKRHADMLEAFSRLGREDCHLVLVGKGPLEKDMRRKSQILQIADKVHFLGYRTDIPIILKSAWASILPSEREGLPRVVMESMSMGVPVIASNIRGARDLLGAGEGCLFPGRNVVALTERMKELAASKEYASSLGYIGRQKIEKYKIENLLSMHAELYEKFLLEKREINNAK